MLKFVRTKNFQMPENRRMTDLQVYRDAQSRLVQEEKWEKDVAVPTPYSSGTVKYKRTYLVTEKPGRIQVDTKTEREYIPSCAGDADMNFQLKVQSPSSIKEKMPIDSKPFEKGGLPLRSTGVKSSIRGKIRTTFKRPLKCIPEEDYLKIGRLGITQQIPHTHIATGNVAAQIRVTATESGQGEILVESPQSNGQNVRDIIKIFESLTNEKKMKKQASAVSFVHRVTEHGRVRLTVR